MKVLLYIPHDSLKVPYLFYKGLIISKEEFRFNNLIMSDVGIKELFKDLNGKRISPKYSRLYCDVERFEDDEKEIMSKYGEGVIYTKTYDGKFFHQHDEKYRNKVLRYYHNYHKKLDKITKRLLKHDDTLLILDLHSFSTKMASHFFDGEFPDICIGIEKDYFDQDILDLIINKINHYGYSYKINYPYNGSIIPNYILKNKDKLKNKKIISIMIEVNKRIYL